MTLDELAKEWLEKQKFNWHFLDMANKWIDYANEIVKAWEEYKNNGK